MLMDSIHNIQVLDLRFDSNITFDVLAIAELFDFFETQLYYL